MTVVNKIEERIINFIKGLSDAQKFAFVSALILGLLAHGFAFFNRLSVHDNSHCLFALGSTYEVNRWGLGIINDIQILTTKTFSLPLFNGVFSMILLGCSAMLVVKIFNVQSKLIASIIGGLMVVFPMVTSSFSFMFTTWPYFLGLLIIVKSAAVFTKGQSLKNFIISTALLAFGLSFYQAFLGVIITIFLLKMFVDVVEAKTESVPQYAKSGVIYLVQLGLGLGLWSVIAKLFRTVKRIELLSYKGWNESYNLAKLPAKLADALANFLSFRMEGINALRYLRMLSALIFIMTIVLIIGLLIKSSAKLSVKLSSIVGLIFIPVAMMIVYLLSTSDLYEVSTMMLYPEVFVYIIPLVLLERIDGIEVRIYDMISQAVAAVLILCTTVVTLGYVYLDNAAYYKAAIYQEQAVVYMTALLANIKSVDGFSDDMPIYFVGFNNVADGTINEVAAKEEMDGIQLEKYYNSLEEMINYGVNLQFMQDHLGIGNDLMTVDDDDDLIKNPVVKNMPTYPNEGGIAIVDGAVVVKMGELE